LEFIQNADDNTYGEGDDDELVIPTISFHNFAGSLNITCNEIGFQPKNVDAICRIAQSTRKDRSKGFIGEEGIGFKSIFKIANVVHVSSNSYSFRFDKAGPLGMIAPIWSDYPGKLKENHTKFFLQLS
jgi:HSP90 family molecular chaperone